MGRTRLSPLILGNILLLYHGGRPFPSRKGTCDFSMAVFFFFFVTGPRIDLGYLWVSVVRLLRLHAFQFEIVPKCSGCWFHRHAVVASHINEAVAVLNDFVLDRFPAIYIILLFSIAVVGALTYYYHHVIFSARLLLCIYKGLRWPASPG